MCVCAMSSPSLYLRRRRQQEVTAKPNSVVPMSASSSSPQQPQELPLKKDSGGTDALREAVVRWADAQGGRECRFWVAVDVGASNVRVQLSVGPDDVVGLPKRQSKSCSALVAVLRAVQEELEEFCAGSGIEYQVMGASLAVAAPVEPEATELFFTNYDPEDSFLTIKSLPSNLFPAGKTYLLNDLEAACFGIWSLSQQGRLHEFFEPLSPVQENFKSQMVLGNNLVLAAGTGLGTGMVSVDSHGSCSVVPMEGGHGQVTPKGFGRSERSGEESLMEFLGSKWRGQHYPEFEDVCSGEGLLRCYEWAVKRRKGVPVVGADAEFVAQEAANGDASCLEAMLFHYRMLMRCAQQLGVVMKGRTVFLAGDNIKHNMWFVQQHWEQLLTEYLDHSRPSLGGHGIRESIVFVQSGTFNFNVEGARYVATHGKQ